MDRRQSEEMGDVSPTVVLLPVSAIQLSVSSVGQALFLNVVEHEGEGLGLLAVVPDRDGGGSLDLLGRAFNVVLAVSEPLAEVVSLLDLDQGDVAGLGKGL